EAATRAATHRDAAHISRRHLLLDRPAAAGVADDLAAQSRGLSGERLPLELLRGVGRLHRRESLDDAGLPCGVPYSRMVDFPDGLPTQILTRILRGILRRAPCD